MLYVTSTHMTPRETCDKPVYFITAYNDIIARTCILYTGECKSYILHVTHACSHAWVDAYMFGYALVLFSIHLTSCHQSV